MPDKKMTAVLQMLAAQVGYSYKVVKKQQLVAALPQRLRIDSDTLWAIVAFLKEKEYLTVKYQDKEEICLSLTVKAENFLTGQSEIAMKSQLGSRQLWLMFLGVFVASLLGGIVATLLIRFIQ